MQGEEKVRPDLGLRVHEDARVDRRDTAESERQVVEREIDDVIGLGNLLQDSRLNHRAQVTAGILAEASSDLIREFFRARR